MNYEKFKIQRKPNNFTKIEDALDKLLKDMSRVERACADRNATDFPTATMYSIINGCKFIEESVLDKKIDRQFFSEMLESGDVFGTFSKKIGEINEETLNFETKKEYFRIVHSKLMEIKESHFSD
ncbi:hypothetical protein ENBRE01_2165 [Enteropsectra breve]|nr:hypothetical protein ENBRE01_2165 [Enteropsectra breve]